MTGFWKAGAFSLGLLSVTGCGRVVGIGPDRVDVWRDTAWDTADRDDTGDTVDTEEPGGSRGALVFTYTFDPGLLGATTCAEARLDDVAAILTPSGSEQREPAVFPCLGQELRLYDLPVGLYAVQLLGMQSSGVTWESEEVDVYVAADELREVPVVLVCQSNEVDDGCGGA